MGCSPDWVTAYPAPVSTPPRAVSAVICCTPCPGSGPATGWPRCQLSPSGDHQMSMAWAPGCPVRPAATNPPPAAVSAVTAAGPAGPARTVSCQWRPPSEEAAANGTEPAAGDPAAACVAAVPTATTRPPTAATPDRSALTACIWPAGPGATAPAAPTVARVQVPRPTEYHAAAAGPP